jgi:transketolase
LPEACQAWAGRHLDLRRAPLDPIAGVDEGKIAALARIVRGLIFASVEAAQSGHPGGSSSKVEQLLTLLAAGVLAFDPARPKHPGRDRIVWSAGHCSPLSHALAVLIGEVARGEVARGDLTIDTLTPGTLTPGDLPPGHLTPGDLARFRRWGGPSGHVESTGLLADTSTGSSGHGLSAGLGFAVLHRSCGLETKVFVIAGDAETEEGITYEARNLGATLGLPNLVVTLDLNGFGIDGPIAEVLPQPYENHWLGLGWNVIEADGHDLRQLAHAYRLACGGFAGSRPTVVLCHSTKGLCYGTLESTCDSHGTPLDHTGYVEVMRDLDFAVPGRQGDVDADIRVVMQSFDEELRSYLAACLRATAVRVRPESELLGRMRTALAGRPLVDYRSLTRSDPLPPELVFAEGQIVPTRKATEAWFAWVMQQSAFFYVGAGDLSKSILTGKAESVYGVQSAANPLGRGLRFGIAEQNMAMMSTAMAQDTLPGGFRPMTAFTTYAVFAPMMANGIRMTLIDNDLDPASRAFFIVLAAHDGPETGEDGPTHHGLFWMALFIAYPGIKVFKPLDANEAVEMLFFAAARGEPVVFSVARPGTPVFPRGDVPQARAAVDGAYVFKPFSGNHRPKKVLVISGGQVLANTLTILPEVEERFDVKIVAVTSPQLFEELRSTDPQKAEAVLSAEERQHVVTLHNGWKGFLYPFMLPADHSERAFGMDRFSRSGRPSEIYRAAGFDPEGLRAKLL